MGVVYAAMDTELGRRVAIKVLPQEVTLDPVRRERFLREARSAAAVKHPAIATVHDIGELDGHVYIVMELVEGQSLRAALQHGPPALAHGLQLAATLADAVQTAHQAGVVHRDLKPENLMLDPSGALKILDFGIAKLDPALVPAAQGVTREGAALGTPGYMSPEQVRGLDVDARTDIFAIGVIVYEMLGGRPPFLGPTVVDVLTATTRDEPAPLCSLDARIPAALESLVHACLRKDASHRPQTAALLATELRRIADELRLVENSITIASDASGQRMPIPHANPDGLPARSGRGALASYPNVAPTLTDGSQRSAQRPAKRGAGLILLAVGAVALLGLVAAAVGAGYLYVQDTPQLASTEKELRQPQAGSDTMTAYLSQQNSRMLAQLTAPAWASAAADFRDAAQQPGAPIAWRASEHFAAGQRLLKEGDLEAALKQFREASVVDPKWALPHVGVSAVSERRGERESALAAAQKAQQLDPKLWLGVRAAARAYLVGEPANYPSAILELRRAKQLAPASALLLGELALAYHAAQLDEEAVRHSKLALQKDPELVPVRVLLAERALEKSDGKEALEHASRAVSVAPDNVSALLAKGDALLLLGRKDEALTSFAEALRLKKETKQVGAPNARLAEVSAALEKKRLPAPRGASATKPSRSFLKPKPQRSSPSPVKPSDLSRTSGSGNANL